MAKIKDIDYLFLSARIRALERNLLTRDRMDRMLDAHTPQEAAQVLEECGYPEQAKVTPDSLNQVLAEEREKLFADLYSMAPDPAVIDVFKVKYDYHNVKVLLKAAATGTDENRLLVDTGRVPVAQLEEGVRSSDLRGIPPILQDAILGARETLGTTNDPQLADFVLDRAYYKDLFQIAKKSGSAFLEGYVRIAIDAANLRSIVRTLRMGKGPDFLKGVLFPGGDVDTGRILSAVIAGSSLADLYGITPLNEAAEAGDDAISGGRLTEFEKRCDNGVNSYLKRAQYVAFGEAPVIGYLAAKETEFTSVRIILTGLMAGLSADTIRERLRDAYV